MKAGPLEFVRQVREEVAKVTWPTRAETITTVWFVALMCFVSALFFISVDKIILSAIRWLLKMGGPV